MTWCLLISKLRIIKSMSGNLKYITMITQQIDMQMYFCGELINEKFQMNS